MKSQFTDGANFWESVFMVGHTLNICVGLAQACPNKLVDMM